MQWDNTQQTHIFDDDIWSQYRKYAQLYCKKTYLIFVEGQHEYHCIIIIIILTKPINIWSLCWK